MHLACLQLKKEEKKLEKSAPELKSRNLQRQLWSYGAMEMEADKAIRTCQCKLAGKSGVFFCGRWFGLRKG